MLLELSLLFIAGVIGGIINSIAGGGSFITFPALLAVGVPPIMANATNTYASCAGYISGAVGFREEIMKNKHELLFTVSFSFVGGAVGAYLLLNTPESLFMEAIPWLLLFSTVLFLTGSRLTMLIKTVAKEHKHAGILGAIALGLLLVGVSAYGGFFNAGLGVIVLSYLVVAGHQDINLMNGLKLLVSTCVSLIAIVIFVANGSIDWHTGSVVLVGTLVGGYLAARVSRQLNPNHVKGFVALSSILITIYFFIDVYV
ncbi:sulfite exporter TauE/SafE family protein [Vibrio alginolyticus]|uniref:sulfite exporter TauE/SafE family protein n=1 Tax=Vibrio alginolyticus TaxID=663 RepID=UPI0015F5D7DD|nr:sulfite exporter TauE/SafE family protein [Vibrio alginolyticus]MCR9314082.1 sulfite exporter TauE/SafE family protein [Vibrio alginolyticus]MCR9318095.1 sulfite exporter TauE/SafE family protein [Vibrio alginolyticus]MCR9404584.1 sulfite exporter TauE/SafE family protein [Vibrio alginolyticus]MCR9468187.1 sulfite exporter TauE/SafE family protein [Vibrio alginolyticus]MCR9482469.1 sulfite exporter TauE/SafE family protein [Vibrio alginolyticus]